MVDIETWKSIIGYEGLYEVSNLGNVKSLSRDVNNGNGFYVIKDRVLKQSKTSTGYKKVELYKNGTRKAFKVHRLVAINFIENKEDMPVVNHKDGNPLNNNVNNLEWCTQKYNCMHALEIGLKKVKTLNKDKLIDLHINKNKSLREISKILNVKYHIVSLNMKRYGIKVRKEKPKKYGVDENNILELLKNKNMSELALELGCDASLLSKYKKKRLERSEI